MTPDSRGLLVRRVLVTLGAITTVGAGAGAVRLASDSSAAGGPADVAPVSITSVQGQMDRAARAAAISNDVASLNDQVRTLFDAVTNASASADAQEASAAGVASDLAVAKARLAKLQAQLTGASSRLEALDATAAKLAASRHAKGTVTATTGASGAAGGGTDD